MSVSPTPARRRFVVRAIAPETLADFDEQWWPVTLLLLVTAGCMSGYIYTHSESDFTTPVWYRNAWYQIGGIGAGALVLLLGAAMLRGSSQRRLQLGIFLSLMFHAALMLWAQSNFLSVGTLQPQSAEQSLADEVAVTIPDYLPSKTPGDTVAEITRPTETEVPKEAKTEIAPKTLEQEKAEKQKLVDPETMPEPKSEPIELAKVEMPAPKREEVMPREPLNRQELEAKLRSEAVTQQMPTTEAALKQSLAAQAVEAARRESAVAPATRMNVANPSATNRMQPTNEPPTPTRRQTPDQTASADVDATLARRLSQSAAAAMPLAPSEAAAARAAQQSPLAAPLSPTETMQRQAASASAGQVAASISPAVTFAPGSAAPSALSRAEAPEPNDSAPSTMQTNRPQRQSGGGAAAGMEAVAVNSPTAPTTTSPETAGGSSLEAVLTTTTRGDQGTPQQTAAPNVAIPSPLGEGSGTTVGSASVGIRRADAAGDGTAGQASAAAVVGRPGRGRAAGSSTAPNNHVSGEAMAGVAAPTAQVGNATSRTTGPLQPATTGTGSSLGERTVAQTATGLRPSVLGGTTGSATTAPSGGVADGTGMASGVSSTGAGSVSGSPSGSASGTRREMGAGGDISGSATGTALTGLGARGKSATAGNGAGLQVGDGLASVAGSSMASGGALPGGSVSGGSATGSGGVDGGASLSGRMSTQSGDGLRPTALGDASGTSATPAPRVRPAGDRRKDGESTTGATDHAAIGRRTRPLTDAVESGRDRYGNLKGPVYDLIAEGQMKGQKILIVSFYLDQEIDESPLPAALSTKGYSIGRLNAPLPPLAKFAAELDGCRQLWLFSSEVNRLPSGHLTAIVDRWRAGRLAICLLADNTPFMAEALSVLDVIAPGTTITGDYVGEQKLHRRQGNQPGFDRSSPLFHNVETLYEGTTISSISSRWLTPVCYASNGLPLVATYQVPGSSRLLLHCGFTSFYERFWDDAGVSRFAVNAAGWLSEADRTNPIRAEGSPAK